MASTNPKAVPINDQCESSVRVVAAAMRWDRTCAGVHTQVGSSLAGSPVQAPLPAGGCKVLQGVELQAVPEDADVDGGDPPLRRPDMDRRG
jgi:hypothetical protein